MNEAIKIRRPKAEIRKKAEFRRPNTEVMAVWTDPRTFFGLRFSDFFRVSGFGFRV
jgi:hypothetical protein